MQSSVTQPNVRRNIAFNVADAAFFGLGMGMSSFVAVIPLFVASLTDSTILIGLISAAHLIGWQLPQLFTAGMVARRSRYLPLVLFMTIHERWPYLVMGLAALALGIGMIDKTAALIIMFVMVWWHALGGGFTATAWQSMISKIMPHGIRGTFYGIQSAAANLMASGGALLAGVLLAALPYPINYAACFILTGVAMMISMVFLAATREDTHEPQEKAKHGDRLLWSHLSRILRDDSNFRAFLGARLITQFSTTSIAFFAIYAVRDLGMSQAVAAGIMTSVMTISQTVMSPLVGRLGDMYGHRKMFILANILMALSAIAAITIRDVNAFALVFMLAGLVNGGQWTTVLAITAEFGNETNRPYYIGLANTSIAPVTIFAPILGGWLADVAGFHTTFTFAAVAAMLAIAVLVMFVQEPRKLKHEVVLAAAGD
jgi:MFS family permease